MKQQKKTKAPQQIYLKDYRPPAFLLTATKLCFRLLPETTLVTTKLSFQSNPAHISDKPTLILYGEELTTSYIKLDGKTIDKNAYDAGQKQIHLNDLPDHFTIESEVTINPEANSRLMGLYRSSGLYCTQCEAEGFRRITWYPDRPDISSIFTVEVQANKTDAPVLLSNGNCIETGDLDGGWHYAKFHDPFPKPAYLFALVAGKLVANEDQFITQSGRKVDLRIWVAAKDLSLTDFAMQSLKKAMKWDEDKFGLEYDLDIFHIVAVDDFNFGAMENKGLNIFNAKYVLADSCTATDADFEAIEAVIAHEYFHNWTGNRVTCRDWFQLSLKEGLTVFRDQSFSEDMRDKAQQRISQVNGLKSHQFPEDASPLAHPVRPDSYAEINNFYTATIYEKGAEIIRMLSGLVGKDGFAKGLKLYLNRHDGGAATCEDFVTAMADANHMDLRQFMLWYRQIGTPQITISWQQDSATGKITLNLSQSCDFFPADSDYDGLLIPFAIGVSSMDNGPATGLKWRRKDDGDYKQASNDGQVFIPFDRSAAIYEIDGAPLGAYLDFNQGFQAPIIVTISGKDDDDILQSNLYHYHKGSDCLSRHQAFHHLLEQFVKNPSETSYFNKFITAMGDIVCDESLSPAARACFIDVPPVASLAEFTAPIDPVGVCQFRARLLGDFAYTHADIIASSWQKLHDSTKADDLSAAAIEKRTLKKLLLEALSFMPKDAKSADIWHEFAAAQINTSNMTDRISALKIMVDHNHPDKQKALAAFHKDFAHHSLSLDKWFSVQAASLDENACDTIKGLLTHADFKRTNPNRIRAVLGAFAFANLLGFHRQDGAGYQLLLDQIRQLDPKNPMVASRLVSAFGSWRRYDTKRGLLMKNCLIDLSNVQGLSSDCREIVSRALFTAE